MPTKPSAVTTVDAYIDRLPPSTQAVMNRVRALVHEVAPDVVERISYQIPAFMLRTTLVYLGAFKAHISIFPPVRDAAIQRRAARYANDKGNLSFPLDEPMPYPLIKAVIQARLREYQADERAKGVTVGKAKVAKAAEKLARNRKSVPLKKAAKRSTGKPK